MEIEQIRIWAEAAGISMEKALDLIREGQEPTAQYFGGATPS